MEKKSTKINVSQVVIFIFCFALAYFAVNYFLSQNSDSVNEMLKENARIANREMPKMLDDVTRLDSVSAENDTLKYYHTLVDELKENSVLDFDLIKTTMSKKAQDNLDTSSVLEDYRENGVYLHFLYLDKNQKEIFNYTVKHIKK